LKGVGCGRGYSTDGELFRLYSQNFRGYYQVMINYRPRLWHCVVWEHFNGKKPKGFDIDHINNVKDMISDNRLSNLQLKTRAANIHKSLINKKNTSGYAGVSWFKPKGKFRARITLDYKEIHLGYFDDPKVAYEAYLAAKVKYHGIESISPLR
jgi:hypothetical protein